MDIEQNTPTNSDYQQSIDSEKHLKMSNPQLLTTEIKKLTQLVCKCHENPCFVQDEEIPLKNVRVEEEKSDFPKIYIVDAEVSDVANHVSEVEVSKTFARAPETKDFVQECICKKSNLIVSSSFSKTADRISDEEVAKENQMQLSENTDPDQPERGGIYLTTFALN